VTAWKRNTLHTGKRDVHKAPNSSGAGFRKHPPENQTTPRQAFLPLFPSPLQRQAGPRHVR
jgi:hypothetical protein